MADRTFISTFISGIGIDSITAVTPNLGIRPGARLMCFGQATNTVAGNTANRNIGFVSLPALAANTRGSVTVPNTLITANSIVRVTLQNQNADATAALAVMAWEGSNAARVAGTSFVIEYMPTALMAQAWVAIYEIIN